ncbi:unnamed protein product [Sphagnum balticum]
MDDDYSGDDEVDDGSDVDDSESIDMVHDTNDSLTSEDEIESDDEQLTPQSFDSLSICEILCRCRKIVNSTNKSSIIHDAFRSLAPSSVKGDLVLDMKVRWGSTFSMIKRLNAHRSTLINLIDELSSIQGVTVRQKNTLTNSKLSDDDWIILEILSNILGMFVEATEMLSGQNYPSLALAYPILDSLNHYLNSRTAQRGDNKDVFDLY